MAGEFNLGSPKQIQAIFLTEKKLELPVIRKTPKGQPSTAEDVLQELAEDYELPRLVILEHRGLSKLKSTYTDKLPQQINPVTQRVHTPVTTRQVLPLVACHPVTLIYRIFQFALRKADEFARRLLLMKV